MNKASSGYRPIVPAPSQQSIIITPNVMTSNSATLAPISPHQSPQSNPSTQNHQHQSHYQHQQQYPQPPSLLPQHNQYQYQQQPHQSLLQSPSHHPQLNHKYNQHQQQQQYYHPQQATSPQNSHQHGGGGATLPHFETPPVSPFSLPTHNNNDYSNNQSAFKLPPPLQSLSQLNTNNKNNVSAELSANNNNDNENNAIPNSSTSKSTSSSSPSKNNFAIINTPQSRFNPILPKQPSCTPSSSQTQQPSTSTFSTPVTTSSTDGTSKSSNQNLINASPIMKGGVDTKFPPHSSLNNNDNNNSNNNNNNNNNSHLSHHHHILSPLSMNPHSYHSLHNPPLLSLPSPQLLHHHASISSLPENKNGNKSQQPTTADQREMARKASHSQIERRRRERINDKIMQLRELIPGCSEQENMHKLNVLQNAIDYIEYLQAIVFEYRQRENGGFDGNINGVIDSNDDSSASNRGTGDGNSSIFKLSSLSSSLLYPSPASSLSSLSSNVNHGLIRSIKKSKFNRYEIPIPKNFLSTIVTTASDPNSNITNNSTINSYEDCEEYKHKRCSISSNSSSCSVTSTSTTAISNNTNSIETSVMTDRKDSSDNSNSKSDTSDDGVITNDSPIKEHEEEAQVLLMLSKTSSGGGSSDGNNSGSGYLDDHANIDDNESAIIINKEVEDSQTPKTFDKDDEKEEQKDDRNDDQDDQKDDDHCDLENHDQENSSTSTRRRGMTVQNLLC